MCGSGTETDLIARAQAGDEEAFRELFERHEGDVARRMERLMPPSVRRKHSVADALQETRLTAFDRLGEFENRGDGSFRRWVLRIAEFKVKAAVQWYAGTAKRAVGREVTRGQRADTAFAVGRSPSPSQAAIAAELRELVLEALTELPATQQDVLRLAIMEQLTPKEIAERTGRSHESVKKAYGRGLSRFTEILESKRGDLDG
ncbi:MAG: RNA polymerase sigma factor [Planctomycetota bacterium]|jgi:RNA polymerase sigma-70 factor (ECF subfamily)